MYSTLEDNKMETLLDLECAKLGHTIIKKIGSRSDESAKVKGMITKLLGVLQEDGVYAFALYAKAKGGKGDAEGPEKRTAQVVFKEILPWLQQGDILLLPSICDDLLSGIREQLTKDLDKLLLCKELLERAMVYARYHAEALGGA
jgi:hypothetical protein